VRISEKLTAVAMAFGVALVLAITPTKSDAATVLSNNEVKLVQESWTVIEKQMPGAIERFYRRYFQLDPAAKSLFDEKTMRVQYDAFANILADVAENSDDLAQFSNRMKRLGALHENLGAEPHQFALFGVAFVDTLRLELKAEFKPRARTAWNKIFYELSKMMEAGYSG
jgi:hemoglobin-like flavoprotein